jgi:tetratricopeptide (TPR) repeat protein
MGMKFRTQESSVPQATRIFTDREEPRKAFWKCYDQFKENMLKVAPNERESKVLVYYGVGGIGKSSLLRQLIKEMDEAATAKTIGQPLHVYFDFNLKQEPRAVLEALRNKLSDDYGFIFPQFDLGCYAYAKKIGENRDRPRIKSFIERSETLRFAFDAVEDIPIVGVASLVARLVDKGYAAIRNMKDKNREELKNIESKSAEELLDELPVLFARDIDMNMGDKDEPLVIFLDTYEQLVNEMATIGFPLDNDLWLREYKKRLGLIVNAPCVFWVIAGREKLKWPENWGDSLEQHSLENLLETDAKNFLQHAGIENAELQDGIYKLTNGTPVYLDLCVDTFQSLIGNGEVPRIEDFGNDVSSLIERFVRYMDDTRQEMVSMLSCLGVWSDEMALEIGPKVLPNFSITTYEKVKGFSFVIESEKGHYNLHQTVGDVLYNKACPKYIKEKAASVTIAYCEEKLRWIDPLSTEDEYYVGWLIKHALRDYSEDDSIRGFYIKHIRPYLNMLSGRNRFHSIENRFNLFRERASRNKESRLYALVQMDYSVWLQRMGRKEESTEMAKSAYELYVKLNGADDAITRQAQKEYVDRLEWLGRYSEVETIKKDVLERRRRILGESHSETIAAMESLSRTYDKMGRYADMLSLAEEILEKRRKRLGERHPDTLKAIWNVAWVLLMLGRFQDALVLHQEMYDIYRETKGEDCPDTIAALGNVAADYKNLGQYDKAVERQKEVLERYRNVLGEDDLKTIAAIDFLSDIYCAMGRYDDMIRLMEQVVEKRRKVLGEWHDKTWDARCDLAYALEKLGRHQEAEVRRQEAERYRVMRLEDFLDTITALGNIAADHENQGQYDKAVELRQEALERCRESLGENHPTTIAAMESLSRTYDEAEALYKDNLERQECLTGKESLGTISALNALAKFYLIKNEPEKGTPYAEKVVNLVSKNPNVSNKSRIEETDTLVLLYASEGRLDEAYEMARQFLNDALKEYASDQRFIASRCYTLAYVLNKMNRFDVASNYAGKAHNICVKCFGPSDDSTKRAEKLLNEISDKLF